MGTNYKRTGKSTEILTRVVRHGAEATFLLLFPAKHNPTIHHPFKTRFQLYAEFRRQKKHTCIQVSRFQGFHHNFGRMSNTGEGARVRAVLYRGTSQHIVLHNQVFPFKTFGITDKLACDSERFLSKRAKPSLTDLQDSIACHTRIFIWKPLSMCVGAERISTIICYPQSDV